MKTPIAKISIIISLVFFFIGCATTPVREEVYLKGPVYRIDNISYVCLPAVLDAYNLEYKWDSLGQRLLLYRSDKEVVLGLGSDIALVENRSEKLSGPVRMHRSVIVIPKDFASLSLAKTFIKKYRLTKPERKKTPTALSGYAIRKVVIDPGHGGKDPGAIGKLGLVEKDIALDMAKRIRSYLERGGINVILTRSDDRFISLWKRSDIANKEDADFFISVHANAARSSYAKGFEVFYLSEAVDDNARAVAAAENASLKYEKSSFGNSRPSGALAATLWDIEYTENRAESIELAEYIGQATCQSLGLEDRGVKGARFYVLKGAKMPSVLVEIGFISNRQDAKKIKNSEYRERLAESIARGIMKYKKEYEATEGFTK
jgi:N-acetylmuramoyl-L-alanine amidase